jgi:hypothetical protein
MTIACVQVRPGLQELGAHQMPKLLEVSTVAPCSATEHRHWVPLCAAVAVGHLLHDAEHVHAVRLASMLACMRAWGCCQASWPCKACSQTLCLQTWLTTWCCLLLQVLAAQGYKPRPGLLSALLDITFDAMSSYTPAQLASMVHSLGTCGCKASVQWMSHLMGRIRMAGLEVGGCLAACLPTCMPASCDLLLAEGMSALAQWRD